MRSLGRVRLILGLVVAGVASSLLLSGCPNPKEAVGVGFSGCHREISGATAVTRTETSKLSCAAINSLVSSIPSEPENYLIGTDSTPRLYWKCRYFGTEQSSLLLRCDLAKRHFSIVKSTG
jgi:hypothetical protein